jgi:hypothetical protein
MIMPTYMTCADSDSDSEGGDSQHCAATIIRCGHVFGRRCLRIWMRLENTCPACRCELYPRATEAGTGIVVLRNFTINIDLWP